MVTPLTDICKTGDPGIVGIEPTRWSSSSGLNFKLGATDWQGGAAQIDEIQPTCFFFNGGLKPSQKQAFSQLPLLPNWPVASCGLLWPPQRDAHPLLGLKTDALALLALWCWITCTAGPGAFC